LLVFDVNNCVHKASLLWSAGLGTDARVTVNLVSKLSHAPSAHPFPVITHTPFRFA